MHPATASRGVREDADHFRTALHLLVEPFERLIARYEIEQAMTADSHSLAEDLYQQCKPLPSGLSTDDFRVVLQRTVAALKALLAGDPRPFNGLWSHADDVSVLGGFGGFERSWDRVEQDTRLAASRFTNGQLIGIDLVTLGASASGDLAFSVWIERAQAQLAESDATIPLMVRVTHIFRREEGAWRLLHRHGDRSTERTSLIAATPP
jgi:SnoaL-like domain